MFFDIFSAQLPKNIPANIPHMSARTRPSVLQIQRARPCVSMLILCFHPAVKSCSQTRMESRGQSRCASCSRMERFAASRTRKRIKFDPTRRLRVGFFDLNFCFFKKAVKYSIWDKLQAEKQKTQKKFGDLKKYFSKMTELLEIPRKIFFSKIKKQTKKF